MRKGKTIIWIIIPAIIFVGIIVWYFFGNRNPHNIMPMDERSRIVLEPDLSLFLPAKNKFPSLEIDEKVNIARAAIMPHHDLASEMDAEIFQKISSSVRPKTIIILSPNHFEVGPARAVSGNLVWQINDAKVETDIELLEQLRQDGLVEKKEDIFENEHGINNLIPFVSEYFPKSKVLPIILRVGFSPDEADKLAARLKNYLKDSDYFLLASLDFSHYLADHKAVEKDRITKQILERKAFDRIYGLNNDFVDSPPVLYTVIKAALDLDLEIIANSNSAEILGRPLESSTSYFTVLFSAKDGEK